MKEWKNPSMEELTINATANGTNPSDVLDGELVSINGEYYRPSGQKIGSPEA